MRNLGDAVEVRSQGGDEPTYQGQQASRNYVLSPTELHLLFPEASWSDCYELGSSPSATSWSRRKSTRATRCGTPRRGSRERRRSRTTHGGSAMSAGEDRMAALRQRKIRQHFVP